MAIVRIFEPLTVTPVKLLMKTPDSNLKTPRPNISDKELDRDLVNLHLPDVDLIASDAECAAMYPPGVYDDMVNSTLED